MDETRHGWIKLEVPGTEHSAEMMKFMVADLKKILPRYEIAVDDTQLSRTVEEQDCETYYEKNLEVTSPKFTSDLLCALRQHFDNMNRRIIEEEGEDSKSRCRIFAPWKRGTLTLHSADFWKTNLISHLKAVPVAAVHFGNIQGGTFLNHWEISFWETTMKNLERKRSATDNMNRITTEFEFDKKEIITVHFQCNDKYDHKKDAKENARPVHYKLLIRNNWIRRIIVDPSVDDAYCNGRTRLHLELNCPVLIKRGVVDREKERNPLAAPFYKRRFRVDCEWKPYGTPETEAVADCPMFTIDFDPTVSMEEIYCILSRLRDRTRIAIEFARIPFVDIPIGRRYPYCRWALVPGQGTPKPTETTSVIFSEFLDRLFPPNIISVNGRDIDVNDERKFSITYLIECILSRGQVVKDQLLLEEIHWERFLELIIRYYEEDDRLCEAALEDLVHLIDGRKRIGSLIRCFDSICQNRLKQRLVNGLTEQEEREGFMRVRKIIFTPTRVIYIAPETIMGNRVIRKFDNDGTNILRVTFRDDDNQRLRASTAEDLLDKTAMKYLDGGIRVANREYGFLGCSNSQMRDNGAYFMLKYSEKTLKHYISRTGGEDLKNFFPNIHRTRKSLGRFEKVENIPKMMARLGQCFTQSRMSGVELPKCDYVYISDLRGGKNGLGKCYEFSDGVGMISKKFAKAISEKMGFGKGLPSCYQIRFRGIKGVIAIEPLLDDYREWIDRGGIRYEYDENVKFAVGCAFRPSQIKFPTKIFPGEQLEMVKFSAPVPVALNKPFINILDQVSEMQSLECHRRVTGRIEELLDLQMRMFAKQMNDETYCRNKLKEFPRRYDIDFMRTHHGFTLSREPFFRSLIKASIKFSISKQVRKEQIPIPKNLGRSMLGIVDETGRLQYGQIFVQFSPRLSVKLPSPSEVRPVLTGTVLITKNPCIVAGDVRIFEAVDIPELHHLYDVVVFPQSGPRPHPDEMAGSDLDGDEYSVIWDPKLLLDRNEDPFDFAVEKEVIPYDAEKIDKLMKEFYVKYLKLDSVGQISNSHLHSSDQYGINADVCMTLAKKNSQAVDFTKSGNPPEPLVRDWTLLSDGEYLPPEVPERIPDYHIGNDRDPMYVSPRLCGKLFREFKSVDDVIKISEERDEQLEIEIDETIHFPGYEKYMDSAKQDLANYNGQLRSIMENYGIKTEGEIISGCILEMRNRISDKDQDDMSLYNTNQMIETKIDELVRRSREKFFTEFGGYRTVAVCERNTYDESNVLNYRVSAAPPDAVMQKAVAWYRACYEEAQKTRENRKLSFAWLVYDVIDKVKEHMVLNSEEVEMGGKNPTYSMLEQHRAQYLEDNADRFEEFKRKIANESSDDQKEAESIVKMYMDRNPGLDVLIFMLLEWADALSLFEKSPMRKHHFALLFILFSTRNLSSGQQEEMPFIPEVTKKEYEEDVEKGQVHRNDPLLEEVISDLMMKFLELLASGWFRKLRSVSFQRIGFSAIFMRGEWTVFHSAALKTYYNILFNLRFEELPISTDPLKTNRVMIREVDPFVVELPRNCDFVAVKEKMKEHSGVEEIIIRELERRMKKGSGNAEDTVLDPTTRFLVSARGSLEAMQRLKLLVGVTIPIRSHLGGKDVSKQMAHLCYKRIMDGFV